MVFVKALLFCMGLSVSPVLSEPGTNPPNPTTASAFMGQYRSCDCVGVPARVPANRREPACADVTNGPIWLEVVVDICEDGSTYRHFRYLFPANNIAFASQNCQGMLAYEAWSNRAIVFDAGASDQGVGATVYAVEDTYIVNTSEMAEAMDHQGKYADCTKWNCPARPDKCPHTNFTVGACCPTNFQVGQPVSIPATCKPLNLGHVPQCRDWYEVARKSAIGLQFAGGCQDDPAVSWTAGCAGQQSCVAAGWSSFNGDAAKDVTPGKPAAAFAYVSSPDAGRCAKSLFKVPATPATNGALFLGLALLGSGVVCCLVAAGAIAMCMKRGKRASEFDDVDADEYEE